MAGKDKYLIKGITKDILDRLPFGAYILNKKGTIIYFNPAMLRMAGSKSEKHVIGLNALKMPSYKKAGLTPYFKKGLRGTAFKLEAVKYISYTGKKTTYRNYQGIPLKNEKGSIEMLLLVEDVTELQQAQANLQKSEERFKQMAEIAKEWIWEVDSKGLYTYSSPVVKDILGYKPEEVVNKKYFYDLFEPKCKARLKKASFQIFKAKKEFNEFINENRAKDGKTVILKTNGIPVLDSKGRLLGYKGLDKDVTDFVLAEKKLEEQQKEQQVIFDSLPAWVFYKDKKNNFVRVNKALADVMGMPREKLEGQPLSKFYPKKQAEAYWKDDKEVMASGRPKRNIIEPMDSPEGTLWVKTDKIPYRNEEGNIMGIIGFALDITEQKEAEEELAYLATFASSNPNPLMRFDNKGKLVYANEAGKTFLSWGKHSEAIIAPTDVWKASRSVLKKGKKEIAYIDFNHKAYEFVIVPNAERTHVTLYGTDISKLKQAAEKAKEEESRYRTIFDSSPVAMFLLDDKWNVIDANKSVNKMLGYGSEELRGMNLRNAKFMSPKTKARAEQIFKRRVKGEMIEPYEIELITKTGQNKTAMVYGTLLKENHENAEILIMLMDVTERNKAEKEIQKRVKELETFKEFAVGRELKMIELKKRIKEVEEKLKQEKKEEKK